MKFNEIVDIVYKTLLENKQYFIVNKYNSQNIVKISVRQIRKLANFERGYEAIISKAIIELHNKNKIKVIRHNKPAGNRRAIFVLQIR